MVLTFPRIAINLADQAMAFSVDREFREDHHVPANAAVSKMTGPTCKQCSSSKLRNSKAGIRSVGSLKYIATWFWGSQALTKNQAPLTQFQRAVRGPNASDHFFCPNLAWLSDGDTKQFANPGCRGHRQCAPEGHASHCLCDWSTACAG